MTLILRWVLVKIMRRASEGERSAPPQRFFVQNALPPAIFHVECFSLRLLNVCTRQSLWYNNAQSGRRRAISATSPIFRAECAASGDFSCGMNSLCDFCERYMTFVFILHEIVYDFWLYMTLYFYIHFGGI